MRGELSFLLIFASLIFITSTSAEAQELMVSDGGLLGIEGGYTFNLSHVYYGSTLYIKVSNATVQDYAILVDGRSVGINRAIYTVTQESGTITITTNPETTNMSIAVLKQDGFSYWLAKYLVFAKSLPEMTGSVLWDTVIYAVLIIPVVVVILIKLAIILIRAVI